MELLVHAWLALQEAELFSPSREMSFVTQPGVRRWPRGVLCHICPSGSAVSHRS